MITIKSPNEIDALFRAATRSSHPLVVVLVAATPPRRGPHGRVAFVAGKKIGGAVTRNRAKRVLRAAVMRAGGPWAGWDVVLLSRPQTATSTGAELDEAIRAVLRKAGVRP